MTLKETFMIIAAIQAAYPAFNPVSKEATAQLWSEMLEEYSYEDVSTALKVFIMADTKGFAPSIGQIVDCIHKSRPRAHLDALEAWSLVSDAISDSMYRATEHFNELPEIARKVIRDPAQLSKWGQLPVETVQSVIQSNFMRMYDKELARQEEIDRMPQSVRLQLESPAPVARITEKKPLEILKGSGWSEERTRQIEKLRKAGIVG